MAIDERRKDFHFAGVAISTETERREDITLKKIKISGPYLAQRGLG